jgi:hypothetical protein
MSDGLHTVHIRVNDAGTGKPTPVRIRCTGPDGTYYAPFGRLPRFSTLPGRDVGGNVLIDSKAYAYIDGSCEIRLPGGQVFIEVHKGPEFKSLKKEISLGVGQMAVRLDLERACHLRDKGWYSGDTRCQFLAPQSALLEGAAEDLAVVNLLAFYQIAGSTHAIPNILSFSGQKPALEMPDHMVVVNTLNQHPVLGSLALLNCHRMVYPLRFGGEMGFDDWTLADWADQCHRKAGLAVWAEVPPSDTLLSGEAAADAILGKLDALEVARELTPDWYTLLDAGLRLPLVGASGKASNAELLGSWRTYARLQTNEPFSYKAWIEALRAGRTFISRSGGDNPPLLQFTLNEQDAGAVVELPTAGQTVRVGVEAINTLSGDRIEIVHNGKVVADHAVGAEDPASLTKEVTAEPGWIAARYLSQHGLRLLAHSSPVYVAVHGQPPRRDPAAVASLQKYLDMMLDWVRDQGRFETAKQREDLAGVFRAAQEKLKRG